MRVFLDTNVWLSATIFSGLCDELLFACSENSWLVTSPLVQFEAHEIFRRKFPHLPQALVLFDNVWREAECAADMPDPADDNDARLVAAANAVHADFFVTGDRRVLDWKQSGSMRIVSPREAWIELFAPHLRGR